MRREFQNSDSSADLDEVLADYMRRVDRGERVNQEALIAAHPALAAELRDYFSQAVAVERLAVGATADFARQATPRGALEVRCPSCHAPMEVAVDTTLTDLTCSVCGSHFSLVDQSKATRMAPPLSKMGRFELIERLGVGGFGSVWKARDKELDRTVAIKIPRAGGMTPEEQEKFFREARAAAQLRHPNIVSVHEVGRDGDSVYIVSDFVRGVTLGDWLTGQQLTSREAAELCAKIADALHHAHEQGVVHRDLKPANIIIDGDGQPHLMDFGLARREVGEVTVTLDGQVLGTPAYMSPEQAQGEAHKADSRSDVYSLGVVLFQLLTGELPFRGNARMLMHQVINDEPPSPRKLNSNVPKDLETITLKCLEKEPARRYQTAADVAAESRRFLQQEPIHARPISRVERAWRWCKRHEAITVLGAVVFSLLALIAIGSSVAAVFLIESNRRVVNAKALADENFGIARDAVDKFYGEIIEEQLLGQPGLQPLRRRLLESALPFYERLFEPPQAGEEDNERIALNQYRLGVIKQQMGDIDDAMSHFEHAKVIQEKLVPDPRHPSYAQRIKSLSETINALGRTWQAKWDESRSKEDLKQAHQAFRDALQLRDELVTIDPKNVEYARLWANSKMNLGIIEQYLNRTEKAEEYLDNAQSKRTEFAYDRKVRRDKAMGHYDAARLDLVKLNAAIKERDDEAARAAIRNAWTELEQATETFQSLVAESPHSELLEVQYRLAQCYQLRGLACIARMDFDSAISWYHISRSIFQPIARENPAISDYRDSALELSHQIAFAQANSGDMLAAAKSLESLQSELLQLEEIAPLSPRLTNLRGKTEALRKKLAESADPGASDAAQAHPEQPTSATEKDR